MFSLSASASAQIVGIVVAAEGQLPPIPVGLVECFRPVVGVRHGDPKCLCRRVKPRCNREALQVPVVVGTVMNDTGASHAATDAILLQS